MAAWLNSLLVGWLDLLRGLCVAAGRVQRVGARPPPRADAVGAGAARAGAAGAAGAARLAGVSVPLVPVPLVLPAARGGGERGVASTRA